LLAPLGVALAILACARAEVPINPASPLISTPALIAGASPAAATDPASYPGPASSPAPVPTAESYPGPTESGAATEVPATTTAVIQPPPTDTPTITPTPLPTDTPLPTATNTPALPTLPPRATAARTNTPTSSGPGPNPTATSPSTPGSPGEQPIPGNAEFVQTLTITNDGGLVVGRPQDMVDQREETWASLRGGSASWILDLGSVQEVAGVRLFAQRDGSDPTTLTQIDILRVWRGICGRCAVRPVSR
jgi:hypothetical protein